MSISFCEFSKIGSAGLLSFMQTAAETRRAKLEMLLTKHGSIAALNAALGWPRTDPKLSQIRNANERPDTGKHYLMGDAMARRIENTLLLERGWMDTPPSLAEQHGRQDFRVLVAQVMEQLPEHEHPRALRLVAALVEPAGQSANGTGG